jgi:glycosyltransferase involved in cell wall biosynthesis
MREAALLLSPEAPYPLHGGGQLRTASILHYLTQHYDVDLLVFREPGAADPREELPPGLVREAVVLDLPYHRKWAAARALRNAARLARGAPPLLDRFASAHPRVGAALKGRTYALTVVEHFWCAPYHQEIAPASRMTVLDLHNIESVLHARCANAGRGPASFAHRAFARAYRSLERQWLPRFDLVLAASSADQGIAKALARRVAVYPNAIPEQTAPQRERELAIAFSGNFEYHPNKTAVEHFAREIWPVLRVRHAGLQWRLIGRNAHAVSKYTCGDARIRVSGPVENGVRELAAVRAAVVPLLTGSGTRVKIIEAWAAGTPVVSTSMGAEGLPAQNLLVADTPSAFADAVTRVLTDPVCAAGLAAAGRSAYEREFTWPAAWRALREAGIAAPPRRARS